MAGRAKRAGGTAGKAAVLLAVTLLAAGLAAWVWFHPDGFPASVLPDGLRRLLPGYQQMDWSRAVAYVPLDDRTDNLEDVELLAEASGWTILLPDRDLFRTALDGQPRNADGTGHGNREALLEWVREMDAAGCDRFVLSLDQLFSGGLVHSRFVRDSWRLSFPDGTAMDEAEAFRRYILPLAEDGNNRVYLFDSVVRLSPTVSYQGVGTEEYYALREYGSTARPALSDSVLTLENVFAQYPYAADGRTAAEDAMENDKFRERLTEDLLDAYLSVRRRKLSLTDSVLTALAEVPAENIYLLIGVDDSSNRPNIQHNELRYIEKRLKETGLSGGISPRSRLMPGLDSLARLLLGVMAREEYGNYTVRASVRYIGGTEGRHSSEFDLYTLEEVADLHLDLFGAERVPEQQAELQFVVMTAPDDPSKADAYREELLSLLESNLRRGIPTVLDEASNNAYGDALEQDLLKRIPFASLAAYAGKYDQANVTGAAFAMGFSRYLYLKCGRTDSPDGGAGDNRAGDRREREDGLERENRADLAQIRQMANSMALTEYILHVRAPLNEYVERVGLDWNNMRFPVYESGGTAEKATLEQRVLRKLETLFRRDLQRVCENLRGSGLLSGVDPWTERTVGNVRITDLYFPWNRTFEAAFTVEAELAESGENP